MLPRIHGTEPGLVIYFCSFLSLLFALPAWLRLYREGILIVEPLPRTRFLPWGMIRQVRSSAWGKGLEVSDTSGKLRARVYYWLTNSEYFLAWLFHFRPDIWQPQDGLKFTKRAVTSLVWDD